MLFSSLVFLFYFLPATLLVYYLSPRSVRNFVLLFFSILFYSWGGTGHAVLLLASITLNFFFAKRIEASETTARRWLIAGIVVNTGLLVYFKYMNFFVENISSVFVYFGGAEQLEMAKVVLPIGISFYTFHQMSMLRDIYRDRTLPKVTYLKTALYVTFFPQLVAGPIVRYKDIIYQIHSRKESIERIYRGIQRFILGLFKKVVIANTCAALADTIMGSDIDTLSTGAAWLGITAYTLQIYFDFSGYSDMAIGLAKLFGFDLLENFNFPYIARSIKDFWRRWHISLSTWFRDYVYIPLGGNKRGNVRTYVNLMTVFVLTGFWHGASWNFLIWGVFHGLFLVIERLGFDRVLDRLPGLLTWAYTMFVVMIGWVFFRLETFGEAKAYLGRMLRLHTEASNSDVYYFVDYELVVTVLVGIFLSAVPFQRIADGLKLRPVLTSQPVEFVKNTVYLGLFLYCLMALSSSTYNPFIYFNF